MTVVIAVNRCLEITMTRRNMPLGLRLFLNSGIAQSVTVFLWANILVFPRWFDYKNMVVDKDRKIEKEIYGLAVAGDGDGRWKMEHTCLRDIEGYNRYYVGIVDTLCTMAIPLAVMVVTTILMMRQLRAVNSSLAISMIHRNQEARNRSSSIMLIGIIILFVICHFPTLFMKIYHRVHKGGDKNIYEIHWVQILNVIKHVLIVTNSSLNFAIYCKDLLFRQIVWKIYNKFFKCRQPESTASCDKTSGQGSAMEVLSDPKTAKLTSSSKTSENLR